MIKNHFVRKSQPQLGNYMEDGEVKFYEHPLNISLDNNLEIDEEKMEVKATEVSTIKFDDKEDFKKYLEHYKDTFKLNGYVEA